MDAQKQIELFADVVRDKAKEIGELLSSKNKAYGNSIYVATDVMKILYPNGISPDQIDDALFMVRVIDKMCRISRGNKKAFGENPYKDGAGYFILQWAKSEFEDDVECAQLKEKYDKMIHPNDKLKEVASKCVARDQEDILRAETDCLK
jgi:hypothetical protein